MSSINQYELFGGPVTDSLENAKSFDEFCFNRLKDHGNKVVYINGETSENNVETSEASQLSPGSIRAAECLQHYGIRAGNSVGVCCENRFEVPCIMFGVFFIGATYTERTKIFP